MVLALWLTLTVALAWVACASIWASETLKTAIHGDTLLVNDNEMKLGAGHWAEPEKSWRSVVPRS